MTVMIMTTTTTTMVTWLSEGFSKLIQFILKRDLPV